MRSKRDSSESKLVFIGTNLDPAALNTSFNACLNSQRLMETRRSALRFAVGEKVECNMGGAIGWHLGEVVALMYREQGMPPGKVAPYQVRLVNGEMIFAPADNDRVVRRPRERSTPHHAPHGGKEKDWTSILSPLFQAITTCLNANQVREARRFTRRFAQVRGRARGTHVTWRCMSDFEELD